MNNVREFLEEELKRRERAVKEHEEAIKNINGVLKLLPEESVKPQEKTPKVPKSRNVTERVKEVRRKVYDLLESNKTLSSTDIDKNLTDEPATITPYLTDMYRDGLVERVRDGRKYVYSLAESK